MEGEIILRRDEEKEFNIAEIEGKFGFYFYKYNDGNWAPYLRYYGGQNKIKMIVTVKFLDKDRKELDPQPRNYTFHSSFEREVSPSSRDSGHFHNWYPKTEPAFEFLKLKYKVLEIRSVDDDSLIYKAPEEENKDYMCTQCGNQKETNQSNASVINTIPVNENMIFPKFQEFYRAHELSDFSIIVGQEKFHVHKIILASRSTVFRTMFSHKDSKESNENCLIINDIDDISISQMLEFMYSDVNLFVFDSSKSYDYSSLLKASDKYDVQDLKEILIDKITKQLDANNVLDYLILSHLHEIKSIKDYCFDIMKNNKEMLKNELRSKFLSMTESYPRIMAEFYLFCF